MNAEQKVFGGSTDADGEPAAQPDAEADRNAPGKQSGTGDTRRETTEPPLGIKEIEQIEDDAPGG
jgi:hypothetical protein